MHLSNILNFSCSRFSLSLLAAFFTSLRCLMYSFLLCLLCCLCCFISSLPSLVWVYTCTFCNPLLFNPFCHWYYCQPQLLLLLCCLVFVLVHLVLMSSKDIDLYSFFYSFLVRFAKYNFYFLDTRHYDSSIEHRVRPTHRCISCVQSMISFLRR